MQDFTRRTLALPTNAPQGEMAIIEFGDPARPVDVIFAHANGFNALTYRQALAPLGKRLRIVAMDLRGHGRTTLPADPADRGDWSVYRDDILALMAALAIEQPVVLAGHSMGGRACLMAAHARPALVKGLVLFEPVLFRREAEASGPSSGGMALAQATLRRRSQFASVDAAIGNWRGKGAFRTWPEQALRDYAADGLVEDGTEVRLACSPAWEASNFLVSGGGDAPLPLLYTTPVKTLVLKGVIGSTCEAAPEDAQAQANPDLEIRVIDGASHFLPMERSDLVREALTDFAL